MRFHAFRGNQRDRRKSQDPETTLTEMGLKKDQVLIDVGCGDGFFTLPAARIVGKHGKVYGIDADEEALELLKKQAEDAALDNVIAIVGLAENTVPCESCADFVFFSIVLHDFDDPKQVLSNANKMLKPSGSLVDLDWRKEALPFGPPVEVKFSQMQARQLIESADFSITSIKDVEPFMYIVTARKNSHPGT